MRFLCRIGWHTWKFKEKWTPSIHAKFVVRNEMWSICMYCGKTEKIFDATFEMRKEELERTDNHTNEDRKPYIGIACYWCTTPEHQYCPSCKWRYTKIDMINRILDGDDYYESE
jgi:ribosomal protein L34E